MDLNSLLKQSAYISVDYRNYTQNLRFSCHGGNKIPRHHLQLLTILPSSHTAFEI